MRICGFLMLALCLGSLPSMAAELILGESVLERRDGPDLALACGSNGGPPLVSLSDWSGFLACAPEREGLREVLVRPAGADLGAVYDAFPVETSVLLDPEGRISGLRVVTDPRGVALPGPLLSRRPRAEFFLMRLYVLDELGLATSSCRNVPRAGYESDVLGMAEHMVCTARQGPVVITVESRLYRRAGEHDLDPETRRRTEGAFWSETRAELRLSP